MKAVSNLGGAPPHNRNAVRHGMHGYLATGSLPKGASYIRRLLTAMERDIGQAVTEKHGEISIYHGALIQTATRHEARAQLLSRWLRKADDCGDKLSLLDRMAILREIGSASDARDRCLRLLGLDHTQRQDVLAALYATSPPTATSADMSAPNTHVDDRPIDADVGPRAGTEDI